MSAVKTTIKLAAVTALMLAAVVACGKKEDAAKVADSSPVCFVGRQPNFDQPSRLHIDMEADFFSHLALLTPSAGQRAER